jgi:hypothetical protein
MFQRRRKLQSSTPNRMITRETFKTARKTARENYKNAVSACKPDKSTSKDMNRDM